GRDSDRARDHLPDGRGSKRLGRLEHHLSRDPSAQVADWIARRHSALAAHSCRDLARAQRWPLIRDAEPGGDLFATWTRLLLPRLEIPRPILQPDTRDCMKESAGFLPPAFQNPQDRNHRVPISRRRRRTEEFVDLAKIADRFNVTTVHSEDESVFRRDDSHEPLPIWRKTDWNGSPDAAGFR